MFDLTNIVTRTVLVLVLVLVIVVEDKQNILVCVTDA
jgi:hypothetical protein